MIGIVGGVGPRAGLDVSQKILEETPAQRDQDHYPTLLFSLPGKITDRTAYLLGEEKKNPAYALAGILQDLDRAGATIAGIPCNTAHAEEIFSVVENVLQSSNCRIQLLNMIEEVTTFVQKNFPSEVVGILCTTGTRQSGVYRKAFAARNINLIELNADWQHSVHDATYDPEYGIKAHNTPVSQKAKNVMEGAVEQLKERGAGAVILGCTELPLAFTDEAYSGVSLIDPNRILAKALIREFRNQPH